MATNRIGPTSGPLRMSTNVSIERQTAKTDFASRVRAGVQSAAGPLAAATAVVAPFIPGGAVLSAAVSAVANLSQLGSGPPASPHLAPMGPAGAINTTVDSRGVNLTRALSSVGIQPGPAGTGISDGLAGMQNENLRMMEIQIAMQRENTLFSTLSNILKVRHDTQKNSIGNIR